MRTTITSSGVVWSRFTIYIQVYDMKRKRFMWTELDCCLGALDTYTALRLPSQGRIDTRTKQNTEARNFAKQPQQGEERLPNLLHMQQWIRLPVRLCSPINVQLPVDHRAKSIQHQGSTAEPTNHNAITPATYLRANYFIGIIS